MEKTVSCSGGWDLAQKSFNPMVSLLMDGVAPRHPPSPHPLLVVCPEVYRLCERINGKSKSAYAKGDILSLMLPVSPSLW